MEHIEDMTNYFYGDKQFSENQSTKNSDSYESRKQSDLEYLQHKYSLGAFDKVKQVFGNVAGKFKRTKPEEAKKLKKESDLLLRKMGFEEGDLIKAAYGVGPIHDLAKKDQVVADHVEQVKQIIRELPQEEIDRYTRSQAYVLMQVDLTPKKILATLFGVFTAGVLAHRYRHTILSLAKHLMRKA